MEKFTVHSTAHTSIIDITQQVQTIVNESGVKNGICYVFIPHTTAAVSINENADPDVKSDMLMVINKVIPLHDSYRHMEGNSAAHIKASLFGNSVTVFLKNGRVQLGTWKGIFCCEFAGPRTREVWINLLKSE